MFAIALIDGATLLAFCLAAAAVVISPGPDTLLILRNTLSSGQGAGLATVLGVQLGLLVHTTLAVLGISLIIVSSPWLFRAVTLAGALYLAWLGLQGFRGRHLAGVGAGTPPVSAARAVRDAMLTNVLNPKVILLFIALLPNFVDPTRGSVTAQLLLLAALLIVINVIWQAPLAWAAGLATRLLTRARTRIWLGRITGTILLCFAALMVMDFLLA